MSRGGCSRRNR
eukprot:gene25984-biopygen17899